MVTDGPGAPRRMRADARDNRERVLRAAKEVFARDGAEASLNKIAQSAGVGAGTLYRHFPTLQALLVAIISDDVSALCAQGRALMEHPDPDEALGLWLRAMAVHARAMRGLVATQMIQPDPALAGAHEAIGAAGGALLARAQREGAAAGTVGIADLLMLVNAIAWASEQAPEDEGLLDRLLALVDLRERAEP